METYAECMKAHLAKYKIERIGVLEDGFWSNNGKPYAHILPERLHRLNILESIRREFWQFFALHASTLALHKDFHHLNSSQAFAFNLFFPWAGLDCASGPLLAALKIEPCAVREWTFEFMPEEAEGTVVDLYAELDGGARLLIEVKLTESGFGGCDPNGTHQKKLLETYSSRLKAKVTEGCLDQSVFFPNYQLFRNVSHLDIGRGDTLILLVPRANEMTWQQGHGFCDQRLTQTTQQSVKLVAVEDVLSDLSHAEELPCRFRGHLDSLCEKYLPITE